jgi:hypothetical protein
MEKHEMHRRRKANGLKKGGYKTRKEREEL